MLKIWGNRKAAATTTLPKVATEPAAVTTKRKPNLCERVLVLGTDGQITCGPGGFFRVVDKDGKTIHRFDQTATIKDGDLLAADPRGISNTVSAMGGPTKDLDQLSILAQLNEKTGSRFGSKAKPGKGPTFKVIAVGDAISQHPLVKRGKREVVDLFLITQDAIRDAMRSLSLPDRTPNSALDRAA